MPPASATAEPMPANHAAQDVGVAQPAAQPADAGGREVKIRSVMPAEFMMLPIRMNSGAEQREQF